MCSPTDAARRGEARCRAQPLRSGIRVPSAQTQAWPWRLNRQALHELAPDPVSLMLWMYEHHRDVSSTGDYPRSAVPSAKWFGQRHAYDAASALNQD